MLLECTLLRSLATVVSELPGTQPEAKHTV